MNLRTYDDWKTTEPDPNEGEERPEEEEEPEEEDPMQDLPREELMSLAQDAIDEKVRAGFDAFVHFKFTCEKCGERCCFEEPNMLRENGECFKCGHVTVVERGGFMLVFKTKTDAKEDQA